MSQDLKRIIEALLFVSETPLSLNQLCHVLEANDRGKVRQALVELREDYQQMQRAFELVEVAGGWSFRTREEHAYWLRKLRRQQVTRLSRAALETLAIVAYRQPVLKAEIERIRGVEVGGILRMLLEKGLLRVAGRKDLPGRPLVYATTKKFLEVFDLKNLGELPTVEELEALSEGEAAEADLAPSLPLEPVPPPAEETAGPGEAAPEEPRAGEEQTAAAMEEPAPEATPPSMASPGTPLEDQAAPEAETAPEADPESDPGNRQS